MRTEHEAIFETVLEFCADLHDAAITFDYSGRGMYGARCLGVSLDKYDAVDLRGALAAQGLPEGRTDAMGLGVVVYWPSFEIDELPEDQRAMWDASKWAKVDEEDEEDEDEDDDEDEDEDDDDEEVPTKLAYLDPLAIGQWLAGPKGRAHCG